MNYPELSITLEEIKERIDKAIPQEWTRVWPTEKKIDVSFSIDLPDENRSIELMIDRIEVLSGQQVIIKLKATRESGEE